MERQELLSKGRKRIGNSSSKSRSNSKHKKLEGDGHNITKSPQLTPPLLVEHNDGTPSKRLRLSQMSQNNLFSQATSHGASQSVSSRGIYGSAYNDPIHQHIMLDDLTLAIMDTPQFQRLRSLKQLGTCDYVFRGATHTRFEHSIGVAYLAEKVMIKIREHQPDLDISDVDVLCVKVAGLCHDLGHGPFSHVFDGVFIRQMWPGDPDKGEKPGTLPNGDVWEHEEGSIKMFEYLITDNNINLKNWGIMENDILFIKEIIRGVDETKRRGRPSYKFWMYDIVNNKRSGLDVDKLDYFQRDMKYANVPFNNDFERFIELGRVLPAQPITSTLEELQSIPTSEFPHMICYPQKMYEEALSLFSVRFKMHRTVYTHKTVKQVEYMIVDALTLANDDVIIHGKPCPQVPDGQYKMSETIFDMSAYVQMKDSILDYIMFQDSTHKPKLKQAQELLIRINKRQLYKCVGKMIYKSSNRIKRETEEGIMKEILKSYEDDMLTSSAGTTSVSEGIVLVDDQFSNDGNGHYPIHGEVMSPLNEDISKLSQESIGSPHPYFLNHPGTTPGPTSSSGEDEGLTKNDIIVEKMHVHYGQKGKNPVSQLRFFPKHSDEDAIGNAVDDRLHETALPKAFEDFAVRVFCRFPHKEDMARRAFRSWLAKEEKQK